MTVPFQKPGMLKGVMQKVNPFKSTSQVPGFSSALVMIFGQSNKAAGNK